MISQVIVSNWRRPDNVVRILEALRNQTAPFDRIIVVDNGRENGTAVPVEARDGVHYWDFPDMGIGPPCRFLPALLDRNCLYTLFIDDDMLPGPGMHKHLQETADSLHGKFATIGEIGRIYGQSELGYEYRRMDVRRSSSPVKVDLTCRAHFVSTRDVIHALTLRNRVDDAFINGRGADDLFRHDDILLCCGIQLATNEASYLTPKTEPDKSIEMLKLPEPHAMWHRPKHMETRSRLIRRAAHLGWNSQL